MRHSQTPSESALWRRLRGKQLGVLFRRQVVVSRFVLDFCAPSRKLVVEVDGAYHAQREAADERRDLVLQRLGYRVLRFSSDMVADFPDVVVAFIRAALQQS
jgi:very-short-patch-repair endonuclease